MKTKPPPDRRKFADVRDEMEYLYHKLLYWLYERGDAAHARTFAERLARLLSRKYPGKGAIFPEECWSLICEARGDLQGAIAHRQNEIQLIKRLHEISQNGPQHEAIRQLYSYGDLIERLQLLAGLYLENGQVYRAFETFQETKQLCAEHGITFDGDDSLLLDATGERSNSVAAKTQQK
jgi:hypothetical protein